jgi:hypothetical protein
LKKSKKRSDSKDLQDFLYPPMPGTFSPYEMKKKPVEFLREKYLKTFAATAGNHSIAMYFCAWEQDDFEAALDDDFQKRIDRARAQVADRAAFVMNRALGLVENKAEAAPPINSVAALAVIVKNLRARREKPRTKARFNIVVPGLVRGPAQFQPAPEAH